MLGMEGAGLGVAFGPQGRVSAFIQEAFYDDRLGRKRSQDTRL